MPPFLERYGNLHSVWATKYKDGWAIYRYGIGLVSERLTMKQAQVALRRHGVAWKRVWV